MPNLPALTELGKNGTWLLMSRNNSYLKNFETQLQIAGEPYLFKGAPSIIEEDLTLIRACLKIEQGLEITDEEKALTGRKLRKRYVGNFWYNMVDWPTWKILYLQNYMKKYDIQKPVVYVTPEGVPRIRINSIHTSKGAEAQNVVVLLDISKNVFDNYAIDPDSEHRVFYVAFTRAKENLFIVRSQGKYGILCQERRYELSQP